MPIEIMELVIKAQVSDSGTPDGSASIPDDNTAGNEAALEPIEKAVKEILDILKRKNER